MRSAAPRRPRRRPASTPEGALLQAVGEYLDLSGVFWMRMNSGTRVIKDEHGKSRVFRGHAKGTADVLVIRRRLVCDGCHGPHVDIGAHGPCRIYYSSRSRCCGRSPVDLFDPIWLELKATTGQSDAQREFQRRVEAEGHTYLVIRDVREVVAAMEWKHA